MKGHEKEQKLWALIQLDCSDVSTDFDHEEVALDVNDDNTDNNTDDGEKCKVPDCLLSQETTYSWTLR